MTAPEVETIHLRGTGGIVWTYSLPLSPEINQQWTRHEMIQVNADGSPWVEPTTGEAPVVARPADGAVKSLWVGYAVWKSEQLGEPITVDTADAMTKTDIVEKYGKD